MSRLYSATFAARAFARCRATYRDICLNRSDIRDWRARPRAARARRRSTSLTCRDICLESSDICPLSRGCGRAACGTARCRSTCRDICLDSSDTPRLSSGCGRAALGIAPCRSTCRDFCRVRVRFMSCRVATFAEIHSTKDIDICRKFNDIYAGGNPALGCAPLASRGGRPSKNTRTARRGGLTPLRVGMIP